MESLSQTVFGHLDIYINSYGDLIIRIAQSDSFSDRILADEINVNDECKTMVGHSNFFYAGCINLARFGVDFIRTISYTRFYLERLFL